MCVRLFVRYSIRNVGRLTTLLLKKKKQHKKTHYRNTVYRFADLPEGYLTAQKLQNEVTPNEAWPWKMTKVSGKKMKIYDRTKIDINF